jgi:hypothetical protein
MKTVRKVSKIYRVPLRLTLVLSLWTVVVISLLLLLFHSNPESIGPIGVTIFFVLIFVALITTLALIKMIMLRTTKVTIEGLVGLSLIPTILLALRSLRQLTALDVILIVLFALLVNFYIRKMSKPNPSN